MNKQITEQIKKIKGVKTVEPMATTDRVMVTFEAESIEVYCEYRDQFKFLLDMGGSTNGNRLSDCGIVVFENKYEFESDEKAMPFVQYIIQSGIIDEWKNYLKSEANIRGYKKGVRFKSAYNPTDQYIIESDRRCIPELMRLTVGEGSGSCIYYRGKWAEIIPAEKMGVHCDNIEQFNFILTIIGVQTVDSFSDRGIVMVKRNPMFGQGKKVVKFAQYVTDCNLTEEWEKYLIGEAEKRYPVGTKFKHANVKDLPSICSDGRFSSHFTSDYPDAIKHDSEGLVYANGKWAEIITDEVELVDGKIYASQSVIFRFKSINNNDHCIDTYSQLVEEKYLNGLKSVGERTFIRNIKLATKKQKQKLIKAEVKNGYFHELQSKDS